MSAGLALVLAAGVLSCIGNLLLKSSRMGVLPDASFVSQVTSIYFLAGLACYGVNVLLFARSLDTVPVSIAYPILAGTGFALLAIAAAVLFGERLDFYQLLGLGSVTLGVILLAHKSS